MFKRNDYARGLFNGLLGMAVEVDPETRAVTALFNGYDEPHRIERDDLIDLQLAYAITCYQAQPERRWTVTPDARRPTSSSC